MPKAHNVKVKNYPGARGEDILHKVEDLVKNKPDSILVYVGTNDITNNVNLANFVKKIVKKVKNFPKKTNVVLSSLIVWKNKKDIAKKVDETSKRLRNYCH